MNPAISSESPEASPQPRLLEGVVTFREISSGAYGRVYLGQDSARRPLAIKEVRSTISASAQARERHGMECYLKEFQNGGPHLLCIHQISPMGESPLRYSMELADNLNDGDSYDNYESATLQAVLERRGVPSIRQVVDWMHQLLDGLQELHFHGLLHRDLKPGNLYFVDGKLKIGDFSLVTTFHKDASLLGTLEYIPEDIVSASVEMDLYAVGKILYTMVTGLSVRDYPRIPAKMMADAGMVELNRFIVEQACSNDSRRRFHSVAAFRDAFDSICDPVEKARRGQRLRRGIFISSQLVVVCALLLAVLALLKRQRVEEPEPLSVSDYQLDTEEWYGDVLPTDAGMEFRFGDQSGVSLQGETGPLRWSSSAAVLREKSFELYFETVSECGQGMVEVRLLDRADRLIGCYSCVVTPQGVFSQPPVTQASFVPRGASRYGIRVLTWNDRLMLLGNGRPLKDFDLPVGDPPWHVEISLTGDVPGELRLERICCFGAWAE